MHKLLLLYLLLKTGKIPGQPEIPVENVSMVSTGWGNPSRRSSRINHAGRHNPPKNSSWDGLVAAVQEDPRVPMISCLIYDKNFEQCLCNLGVSVNIMPMVIYEKLQYPALSPTYMAVQFADSTIRYPERIIENILVWEWDSFIIANFIVMDIEGDFGVDLILGRPFQRAAEARIDVERGEIWFRVRKEDMFFRFKHREEQRFLIYHDSEGQPLWGEPLPQPEPRPTTQWRNKRRLKKVWRKVKSTALSNSPR